MDCDPDETHEDEGLNAVGAGAQSVDPNVGEPVSGMPVGGPHDLGEKAARKEPDSFGPA
jgi:hypothetical protein